jgi:ABC-type proline/glycine betaine transport system substrate-binding protein
LGELRVAPRNWFSGYQPAPAALVAPIKRQKYSGNPAATAKPWVACPSQGRRLKLMTLKPEQAAKDWIAKNPERVASWLQ